MEIRNVIAILAANQIIDSEPVEIKPLSGGTVSELYLLWLTDGSRVVVKSNDPQINKAEGDFLRFYRDIQRLPRLLYVDPNDQYIVYSFVEGSVGYDGTDKQEWLTILVRDVINQYRPAPDEAWWGWADEPVNTWKAFLLQRVMEAGEMLKSHLGEDDFNRVLDAIQQLEVHTPYLLHGDFGVHNFIFYEGKLTGLIDPTPVFGDPLYDLLYAIFSSPDQLTRQTVETAVHQLNIEEYSVTNLYENILIVLYLRLSTCLKHHPDDFEDYLGAWEYWKGI
ncbi:phosphotransferase family protein [Fictibacillus iocasae]|uniref:Phosphotransferase family protein n=1 Tax=Fictibacillus iocasae TaxID=2715437 RepID=A0ABW2NQT8_9BACL